MGRQRSTAKGGTERSGIEDERGTGWIEREKRESESEAAAGG